MPITAITIENFKGIRGPVRIELRPITLLFGPNSSGKSTIIQALHYAHEILERENVDPGRTLLGGTLLDLGGFESVLHNHDLSLPIVMRFELDMEHEDLPSYYEGYEEYEVLQLTEAVEGEELLDSISRVQKAWVEVSIRWSHLLSKPILSSYKVGLNGVDFSEINTSEDSHQIYISQINPIHPIFLQNLTLDEAKEILLDSLTDSNSSETDFTKLGLMLPTLWSICDFTGGVPGTTKNLNLVNQKSALPRWEHCLVFDREIFSADSEWELEASFVTTLSSLVVGPGEILRDALRNFLYLGPLREIPSRTYEPARSPDESRWASGIAAWDVLLKAEPSFVEKVNGWLAREDRLNSGYNIEVNQYKELDINSPLMLALLEGRVLDEDDSIEAAGVLPTKKRLVLREDTSGIEVMAQDVGVGISQIVPVIVAALHSKSGIVIIEQPELHIHPAFQVALGDLLISEIAQKDVTFLIETHSEHLLLRLLRRIRETHEDELPPGVTGLTPNELAVYYVEKDDDGVRVSELKVSEDGDSEGRWPDGFFEERHGELY